MMDDIINLKLNLSCELECGCVYKELFNSKFIEATRFMNCPISFIRMNIKYVLASTERGVASRMYGCGYVLPCTQIWGMGEQCTHWSFGE